MPPPIGYLLTQADRAVLMDAVRSVMNEPKNYRNRHAVEVPDYPSTDCYIALTPTGGIPALTTSGTGSGTSGGGGGGEIRPGSAICSIYKIQKFNSGTEGLLGTGGLVHTVFNMSTSAIPGDEWIVVAKEKFGAWLAVFPSPSASVSIGGVNPQNSNYTIQQSDSGKLILCTLPSSGFTLTLPPSPSSNFFCDISVTLDGYLTGVEVTLQTAGGGVTIDGNSAIPLWGGDSLRIYYDGANYWSNRGQILDYSYQTTVAQSNGTIGAGSAAYIDIAFAISSPDASNWNRFNWYGGSDATSLKIPVPGKYRIYGRLLGYSSLPITGEMIVQIPHSGGQTWYGPAPSSQVGRYQSTVVFDFEMFNYYGTAIQCYVNNTDPTNAINVIGLFGVRLMTGSNPQGITP